LYILSIICSYCSVENKKIIESQLGLAHKKFKDSKKSNGLFGSFWKGKSQSIIDLTDLWAKIEADFVQP
jgi:hypothetical protein